MLTFGTAGHIDHGKSSLVTALTSINPDRLPEEQERGMTIDLGFAWFALPSGDTVGIIDVPGHKQFVHNVIPGLFGIDAVLLVVAADDGWMPQSEEHVQILDLLGIKNGIVALNKVDLVSDPEWLLMVQDDIRQHLSHTSLAGAPIIPVSAKTGQGLDELKAAINRMACQMAPRLNIGKPRLPIDRVFTIKGSGVVVTGTMGQGSFVVGDDVILSPSGLHARIRFLESYKHEIDQSQPGNRLAINLAGIKKEEIKRGDIVLRSDFKIPPDRVVDVSISLLAQTNAPLKNMTELQVYLETRELLGRVVFVGSKMLKPGETSLAQLRFLEDLNTFIGERFIIRQQSPAKTIGGGVILDPSAQKLESEDSDARKKFLLSRIDLTLESLILSEVEKHKYIRGDEVLEASIYSSKDIAEKVVLLIKEVRLISKGDYLIDPIYWRQCMEEVITMLEQNYSLNPFKEGIPQAEVETNLGLPREMFIPLINQLESNGQLARENDMISISSHKQRIEQERREKIDEIEKVFASDPLNPPRKNNLIAEIPNCEDALNYMCRSKMLVELPNGILFRAEQYNKIKNQIVDYLKTAGQITIQDMHRMFAMSRKYILPLLANMDNEGITRRQGDNRVLAKTQRHNN